MLSLGEGIEAIDARSLEISHIARDHREAVLEPSGRDEAIARRQGLPRREAPPSVSHLCGYRQYPLCVVGFQPEQPSFESSRSGWIPESMKLNPCSNLPNRQDA